MSDCQIVITQMALHSSYFMIVVIVMEEGIPGIIFTFEFKRRMNLNLRGIQLQCSIGLYTYFVNGTDVR